MKNQLDDFTCNVNIEELEEEFEAWQTLMEIEKFRYLIMNEKCDIINM